jgi:energy-converting hydrogenase Eha subunit H
MNLDQVVVYAVASVTLLGPLFAMAFSIITRLSKIEQRLDGEKERIEESLQRHERHIHEIRNHLQSISMQLARRENE